MPTDPKWRTISRASGQRIGDVIAVFVHVLVDASNATERGRTQSFVCEDVANALDIECEQVEAILSAMQGRVLDGDKLRGWEKRQPAREDGAAERAKAWREAQKEAKRAHPNASERTPNAPERKRTLDTDTDTDTEVEAKDDSLPGIGIDPAGPKPSEKGDDDLPQDLLGVIPPGRVKPGAIACPGQEIANLWDRILCPEAAAIAQWNPRRARVLGARWKEQAESEGWQSKAEGLKWFEDLFTGCRRSRFLMGKVPPKNGNLQFKLKFDWFFGPENFTRVVEGDFHRGN